MLTRIAMAASAFVLAATATIFAAATPPPQPQGSEVAFVSTVQADLNAHFATVADAQKAGYFRYTNEDHTGSISYANLNWQSVDIKHPSQLWYDVKGHLLGADYSVPQNASPQAPDNWNGVQQARWEAFHAHIHYVLVDAHGKETYGATSAAKYSAAGGDLANPAAAPLVKMGRAKNAAAVKHVFLFPAIWDLQVWVKPNPNGAFAEMNPSVTPSATAEKDMD